MAHKIYDLDTLTEKIEEYFNICKEDNVFPDEAGMLVFLDISESTYERYSKDEELKAPIARARQRRESWLVQRMTGEPKLAQGCLNALKQPKNGGYVDRPMDTGGKELTINLVGVGADAFK